VITIVVVIDFNDLFGANGANIIEIIKIINVSEIIFQIKSGSCGLLSFDGDLD
jgi:uncharacterized protein YbbK (DUF523 family)